MDQIREGGDRFVAAVEAIYDAAAQPSNWPDALQMVAGVFDDVGANLIWVRDDGSFGTIVSPELALSARDYEKWQHADIRAQHITERSMVARLDVVTDRHLVTPQQIEEHPFYTQFLVPHGLGWVAAANVHPICTSTSGSAFSALRARRLTPTRNSKFSVVSRATQSSRFV